MPKQRDGYRVLPWVDWAEWLELKDMLDSKQVADANAKMQTFLLRRSNAVPIAMLSSVSLMHQLENPSSDSYTQRLGLSMAITRLVNGITDRLQPRGERAVAKSVASLAGKIGMPLSLVEIRHQSCHNELPALSWLNTGAREALEWLKQWYWEPQLKNVWPYVKNSTYMLDKIFKGKLNQHEQHLMDPAGESVSGVDPINWKESDAVMDKMNQILSLRAELLPHLSGNNQNASSHPHNERKATPFGLLPGQKWVSRPSLMSYKRQREPSSHPNPQHNHETYPHKPESEQRCIEVDTRDNPGDDDDSQSDDCSFQSKRIRLLSAEEKALFNAKVEEYRKLLQDMS